MIPEPYYISGGKPHEWMKQNPNGSTLQPRSGIAAAVISALAGIATTIGTNIANQHQVDRQNAYNTPASQMARYRAAGLNPHLIYGQGNSGNQQQIAQYQSPDLAGLIGAGSGMMMNESTMELQKYQAENMHEQNKLLQAQTISQLLSNKWIDKEKKSQLANQAADTALKGSQVSVNEQEIQKLSQDILESKSRVDLNNAQKEYSEIQKKLADVDYYIKDKVKNNEVSRLIAIAQLAKSQADYEKWANEWFTNVGYPKELANQNAVSAIITELKKFFSEINGDDDSSPLDGFENAVEDKLREHRVKKLKKMQKENPAQFKKGMDYIKAHPEQYPKDKYPEYYDGTFE